MLASVAVAGAILGNSVTAVLAATFTYPWFSAGLVNNYDLTAAQMQANYDRVVHYSLFPWVSELRLDTLPMSDSGRQHFADAKDLFQVFVQAGLGWDFMGWIAIHGTTELFALFISGAAGLRIGTAFAFPGPRSRLTAASEAGKTTGAAMIGVVIMLLVAGLLEGFGRQLIQSTALRYAVGGTMLLFWPTYFYAPRRSVTASAGDGA